MKIRDLKDDYPLIYEAALRNQKAEGNVRDDNVNVDHLVDHGGFFWTVSPQGWQFWEAVNEGDFETAKAECPDLFEKKAPQGQRKKFEYKAVTHKLCAENMNELGEEGWEVIKILGPLEWSNGEKYVRIYYKREI